MCKHSHAYSIHHSSEGYPKVLYGTVPIFTSCVHARVTSILTHWNACGLTVHVYVCVGESYLYIYIDVCASFMAVAVYRLSIKAYSE